MSSLTLDIYGTQGTPMIYSDIGTAPAILASSINNVPVSTLTTVANNFDISGSLASALSSKAPTANPTFTGTVTGVTKAHIGLSAVENYSSANMPISNAVTSALGGKQDTLNSSSSVTVGSLNGVSASTIGYLDATSSIQTQLNGKQPTLNSSSSVTVGSLNGKSATTIGYLDATSSIQTQINSKQNTITSASDITMHNLTANAVNGITSTTLAYIDPTSSIQTQINSKQNTITSASDITMHNLTANAVNGITSTTLGYIDPTSSIQTQINSKQNNIISTTDLTMHNLTANSVNGVSSTVFPYIDPTSSIQTQLNGKQATITSSSADITTGNLIIPTGKTINATLGGITAPTKTQGDNSTNVATTAYTDLAISNLVNSAPASLNTLSELSSALGADANFSTTVTNLIGTKGGLSSSNTWSGINNYTGLTNTFSYLPKYGAGSDTLINKVYVDDALQAKANLASNNHFTSTNTFDNLPSFGSGGDTFINKAYVDTQDATKCSLTSNNSISGQQTWTNTTNKFQSLPLYQSSGDTLINKTYVDTQDATKANLASSNHFTSTNNYDILPTYGSSGDTLINKAYCDGNFMSLGSGSQVIGGQKTFNQVVIGGAGSFVDNGNMTVGDSSSDVMTVNATSTFNAPINLSSGANIVGNGVTFKNGSTTTATISTTATPTASTDVVPLSYLNTRIRECKYSNFVYGLKAPFTNTSFSLPQTLDVFLNWSDTTKNVFEAMVQLNWSFTLSKSNSFEIYPIPTTKTDPVTGSTSTTYTAGNFTFSAVYAIYYAKDTSSSSGAYFPPSASLVWSGNTNMPSFMVSNTYLYQPSSGSNSVLSYTPLTIVGSAPYKVKITFGFPSASGAGITILGSGSKYNWISSGTCSCSILSSTPNGGITYFTPSALSDGSGFYNNNCERGGCYLSSS